MYIVEETNENCTVPGKLQHKECSCHFTLKQRTQLHDLMVKSQLTGSRNNFSMIYKAARSVFDGITEDPPHLANSKRAITLTYNRPEKCMI
jgi:hypothetical protein